MADRPDDSLPRRNPDAPKLARRAPVTERESIETEEPAVVGKVASLLSQWAEKDD
jgi:hypothetical protein